MDHFFNHRLIVCNLSKINELLMKDVKKDKIKDAEKGKREKSAAASGLLENDTNNPSKNKTDNVSAQNSVKKHQIWWKHNRSNVIVLDTFWVKIRYFLVLSETLQKLLPPSY